jgi:hypothetical protein
MTYLGRIVGVIVVVLLVVGAMVFFFFRSSFSAEGLHRVQSLLGMEAPQPERHIVDNGFHGWAILNFGVDGAAPLAADNGVLIVEYPASGRLETSTPAPADAGFLHREYYRRTDNGLEPLSRMGDIWGEYNLRVVTDDQGTVAELSTGFFVGTLAEFRAAERPRTGFDPPELPALQD